ncbi:hypothetical protein D3C80_1416230 [compost metagenome]
MCTENQRIGFFVRFRDKIHVLTQADFLRADRFRRQRLAGEVVINLIGHITVLIDALLQQFGGVLHRAQFIVQISIGVIIAIQAQPHDQQQNEEPKEPRDIGRGQR